MTMRLERATLNDYVLIHGMKQRAYREVLRRIRGCDYTSECDTPERVRQWMMQHPCATYWLITVDGQNVGAACVERKEDCRKRIVPIFILEEHRRKGLARQAILELERIYGADGWEAEMIVPDKAACRLLESVGYVRTGEIQHISESFDLVHYIKDAPGPDFNRLIPELSVSDIDRSLEFYLLKLPFRMEYERVENGFAFISLDGCQLMLEQQNDNWSTGVLEYPFGRGINLEMTVDDVQALYDRVLEAGIKPFKEMMVNHYRQNEHEIVQKEFLIQDPDGYLLRFTE